MGELAKLDLPLPIACVTTRNIPAPSLVERLSSVRLVPGVKKVGDHWIRECGKIKIKSMESSGRCLQKFAGQLLGLLMRSSDGEET